MLIDRLTSDWKSYATSLESRPAMISVDSALLADAPHAEAPVLHWVTLRMIDPGPSGIGTPDEVAACHRFEEFVIDAAARQKVIFAGRTRWNGFWRMSFYGDYGSSIVQLVDAMKELAEGRQYRVATYDDPAWLHHSCELAPNRDEERWIKNHDVCTTLSAAGDDSDVPRVVDHFLGFLDEHRMGQFVYKSAGKGFTEADRQFDGDRWSLRLQRSDKVTMEHIHEVVAELATEAERAGGVYDGWGCEIIAAQVAAS